MTLEQIKQKLIIRDVEIALGLRDPFYVTAVKKLLARPERKVLTEEELEEARMRFFEEFSSTDVKLTTLSWTF